MKRQVTEWKKIFANDMTGKRLIPNINKQLIQLKSKKPDNPIKQLTEEQNRHFSKEEMQMAKRPVKRCSTLLIMEEKQIKTTVKYHLSSKTKTNVDENVEIRESSYSVVENVNWCIHCGKLYGRPSNPTSGYIAEKIKT